MRLTAFHAGDFTLILGLLYSLIHWNPTKAGNMANCMSKKARAIAISFQSFRKNYSGFTDANCLRVDRRTANPRRIFAPISRYLRARNRSRKRHISRSSNTSQRFVPIRRQHYAGNWRTRCRSIRDFVREYSGEFRCHCTIFLSAPCLNPFLLIKGHGNAQSRVNLSLKALINLVFT